MIGQAEVGIVLFTGWAINMKVVGSCCYGLWQGACTGDALSLCKKKIEIEQ